MKNRLLGDLISDSRELLELEEMEALVSSTQDEDWKFMHFFASCVSGVSGVKSGVNSVGCNYVLTSISLIFLLLQLKLNKIRR